MSFVSTRDNNSCYVYEQLRLVFVT